MNTEENEDGYLWNGKVLETEGSSPDNWIPSQGSRHHRLKGNKIYSHRISRFKSTPFFFVAYTVKSDKHYHRRVVSLWRDKKNLPETYLLECDEPAFSLVRYCCDRLSCKILMWSQCFSLNESHKLISSPVKYSVHYTREGYSISRTCLLWDLSTSTRKCKMLGFILTLLVVADCRENMTTEKHTFEVKLCTPPEAYPFVFRLRRVR